MYLLAVDPGIRGCGVAMFHRDRKTMLRAGYVRNTVTKGDDMAAVIAMAKAVRVWTGQGLYVDTVWVEWPRVYTAAKSKGDPNDLLPLAAVGSAVCVLHWDAAGHRVYPYEWKGQMSKEVCHARTLARMSKEELDRIETVGAKDHNTYDAIGIGLHALGRFERKRVIAR